MKDISVILQNNPELSMINNFHAHEDIEMISETPMKAYDSTPMKPAQSGFT